MKRAIIVALLALAPVVALACAIFGQAGPGSSGQAALDKYALSKGYRVEQLTHASRPWSFGPELSGRTIGDSARYQTHDDFNGNLRREATRSAAAATAQLPSSAPNGRMPLPYPPEEVWCALLASDESRSIVFVAWHQDLYNGAWIVHEPEGAVASRELSESLSLLGCDPNP